MSRRITTMEFIQQAKLVHGDNYDYADTEYVNAFTKVLIRCKKHDFSFWQEAKSHKSGVGCPRCGIDVIPEKLSLSHRDFLQKAQEVHGCIYDYTKSHYTGGHKKIVISCKIHGDFEQTPNNHIHGAQGCPVCARGKQGPQVATEDFLQKSISVHGQKYDYSKVEYSGGKNNVTIGCPTHGWFEQIAASHTQGQGCPSCGVESRARLASKGTLGFIAEAVLVHGDRYDYSRVVYKNGKQAVTIGCPVHGWFSQPPATHVTKRCGCPGCSSSVGERAIEKCLSDLGIEYKKQFKPAGCVYKGQLSYDFWVKNNGHEFLIEFDGVQHFRPVGHFGGEIAFVETLQRDEIKTSFALANGYELIRVTKEDVGRLLDVLREALGC